MSLTVYTSALTVQSHHGGGVSSLIVNGKQ